jgi:hypothetical protein
MRRIETTNSLEELTLIEDKDTNDMTKLLLGYG